MVSMEIMTDKKALAAWKVKHDLHVLLLMERFKLTKAQALLQAYHGGVETLARLMEPRQGDSPSSGGAAVPEASKPTPRR